MISYIPRATQIAFLSPFPSMVLNNKAPGVNKLMYKIIGIEMVLIYIMLIGALFATYIWRKKIELWIMLSFSFYFALVYTYAFPNIGALARYRYAALMLLVALGIAAFAYLYNRRVISTNKINI